MRVDTLFGFVTHTMWDERGDTSNIVGMLIVHVLRLLLCVTTLKMIQNFVDCQMKRGKDKGPGAQMLNYKMNINESTAVVQFCLVQALKASPMVNSVRQEDAPNLRCVLLRTREPSL